MTEIQCSVQSYEYIKKYESWRIDNLIEIECDLHIAINKLRIILCYFNMTYEINTWKTTYIIYHKGRPINMEFRIIKNVDKYYIEFIGITSKAIINADIIKSIYNNYIKADNNTFLSDLYKNTDIFII